jgi:hypothetical protein
MSVIVHTIFSTYEVDTESKRIRRIRGDNPPTDAVAEDGAWGEYTNINWLYNSLFIQWVDANPATGNPRATRTSDIVKIEGDLDIPDIQVVNLP